MTTTKAQVTTINYAGLNFEGLMLPDGEYAIATAQVARLISASPQSITKSMKRKLGAESPLRQVATELSSTKANIATLDQVSKFLTLLAFEGNALAQAFVLASVSEKLERVFDNAFGVVREEQEREDRFYARLSTKATFRPLTDELKAQGYSEGWQYGRFVKRLQDTLGIESGTRDQLDTPTLLELANAQSVLRQLLRMAYTPEEAFEIWEDNL